MVSSQPTLNASDKHYLHVKVGAADLQNQLYYYIYVQPTGQGILVSVDLHTLAPKGSKIMQGRTFQFNYQ